MLILQIAVGSFIGVTGAVIVFYIIEEVADRIKDNKNKKKNGK
jgi:hypothetical protein